MLYSFSFREMVKYKDEGMYRNDYLSTIMHDS